MNELSLIERELVALGAAIASNCVPCVKYHVPEARKAGLSDRQINEAIQLADKVRQVPARKVLAEALGMVPDSATRAADEPGGACPQQAGPSAQAEGPCCG